MVTISEVLKVILYKYYTSILCYKYLKKNKMKITKWNQLNFK